MEIIQKRHFDQSLTLHCDSPDTVGVLAVLARVVGRSDVLWLLVDVLQDVSVLVPRHLGSAVVLLGGADLHHHKVRVEGWLGLHLHDGQLGLEAPPSTSSVRDELDIHDVRMGDVDPGLEVPSTHLRSARPIFQHPSSFKNYFLVCR